MSLSDTAWRRMFLFKGAYNIIVSLALLIWSAQLLPLLGTPAGNPAYPQMFLLLCLAFGWAIAPSASTSTPMPASS